MADMEFEPLHDGSGDEEDQILQKKTKDREKKHSRSKSTPLFKKGVEKREKGDHSRPVPLTMTPQRPVQGLVGPGDMEFNEDSQEQEHALNSGLNKDIASKSISMQASQNGTADVVKPKKPPRQHMTHNMPPIPLPTQLSSPSAGTSTVISNSDTTNAKPQKLTLLAQIKSTTASPSTGLFSDAFPLSNTAPLDSIHHPADTTTAVNFNKTMSSDEKHSTKYVQSTKEEGGLWSPPASENQRKFFSNDDNWANFSNVPQQQQENVASEPSTPDDSHPSTIHVEDTLENDDEPIENDDKDTPDVWQVTDEQREYYTNQFAKLQPTGTVPVIKGTKARDFFLKSTLPTEILSKIWHLSDINRDRALDINEFCIAMHLVVAVRHGVELPNTLPDTLRQLASPVPDKVGSDHEAGTPPQPRKMPSSEPVELATVQPPTSPAEQWAVFPKGKDNAGTKSKTLPANQVVSISSTQQPSHTAAPQAHSNTLPAKPATLAHSPLTSPTNTEPPSLDVATASPLAKKVSTGIARPRVTMPVVNLLDSHPAQLLPPPLSKGKVSKQGKPIPSPVSSPLKVADSPVLPGFISPPYETTESQVLPLKETDAANAGVDSSPYKTTALPRPQKTIVPLKPLSIDKQPERRRSTSSSSDSSDADESEDADSNDNSSDSRIEEPIAHVQQDLEVPPTPPPRKSHGRSSSLDLSKVFGNKQQPSPGSGRPLGNRTVSQDSISSTCSQSRALHPDATADHDSLAKAETDKFADFDKFPIKQDTSAKEIIARPRPLPSHRRSASLDWAKKNSVTSSAKSADIPTTTATDDGQIKLPKRPAPSPPKAVQKIAPEKGPVDESQDEIKTENKKFQAPNVVIRPLEKKSKRQELEETVRIYREKNIAATNVMRDLQSQLREIMTDRVNLETKLEHLKLDKTKD